MFYQEEDLVCLCKLYATVGATYEPKVPKKNMAEYHAQWEKIKFFSLNHGTSRVKFMLRDLIELRNNNWQARFVVVIVMVC